MSLYRKAIGLFVLLVFFSACSRRYGYLRKSGNGKARGIITVAVINDSKGMLTDDYVKSLEECAIKKLTREGFKVSSKKTQFHLTVHVKVDSSFNTGVAFTGGPYPMSSRGSMPGYYQYSRRSRGIIFNLDLEALNTHYKLWEKNYDLYFFDDYRRDLRRSKSVLKFLISDMHYE